MVPEQHLLDRMGRLEKRNRQLARAVSVLALTVVGLGLWQAMPLNQAAVAEDAPTVVKLPDAAKFKLLEVTTLVVRDEEGQVRGMWSANKSGTTLAVAYKDKQPSIVMSATENTASVALSDRMENRAVLAVAPEQRSFSITDRAEENTIYIGTTEKETVLDAKAKEVARLGLAGDKEVVVDAYSPSFAHLDVRSDDLSSLSVSGANSDGMMVNVKKDQKALAFVDAEKNPTFSAETSAGETKLTLVSGPKGEGQKTRVITAEEEKPKEVEKTTEEGGAATTGNGKTEAKKDGKTLNKDPNEVKLDPRTYSPFGYNYRSKRQKKPGDL